MDETAPYNIIGLMLVALGLVFLMLPIVQRYLDIEKVPWVILWVYKSNGFTFATSPLLIIISIISLVVAYFRR